MFSNDFIVELKSKICCLMFSTNNSQLKMLFSDCNFSTYLRILDSTRNFVSTSNDAIFELESKIRCLLFSANGKYNFEI